jgi:hypothetical protein
MTVLLLTPPPVALPVTRQGICAACRVIAPAADLEPVPTNPQQFRCRDEAACTERFTTRPLARSVRSLP